MLHIAHDGGFAPPACAFSKPPVIYRHHIVIKTEDILAYFARLDASCIAVEVEDKTADHSRENEDR